MKKLTLVLAIVFTLTMVLAGCATPAAEQGLQIPDKSSRTRIIVTTDGECDDQNSMRHLLLYANEFDIAGLVYSSSQFHWQGDGVHTLAEVTPNHYNKEEDVDSIKSYRPQEIGWIENIINDEYAEDYKYLVQNDAAYPSPEELLGVTKVGNVEFEGDVRSATEGSDLIKQCILDDDPRKLYIQSWGGFNTVARALLSIAEEYQDTDEWDSIYEKVCQKVVLTAHAQDATYGDYIASLYPDMVTYSGSLGYGYFATLDSSMQARYTFAAEWLSENVKFDHGKMMSNYFLMGDGAYYHGEPDKFQYGQTTIIDWEVGNSDPVQLEKYDWVGEGDSPQWILLLPVGLRGLEVPSYGTWGGRIKINGETVSVDNLDNGGGKVYREYNHVFGGNGNFSASRWLEQIQLDWAARCDWAVNSYDKCNHAPIVSAKALDLTADPGEPVDLEGIASDPDGDALDIDWWVYRDASYYSGSATVLDVWNSNQLTTKFTVPKDAVAGDYFNIILEVTDNASAPMTRYAQIIVKVK